jgi:predicted  nucleic acid-binding Zn-ribbon protein
MPYTPGLAGEVEKLEELIADLEYKLEKLEDEHSKMKDDYEQQIYDLEEQLEFTHEHFPEAIAAFDVRLRMEHASGNTA